MGTFIIRTLYWILFLSFPRLGFTQLSDIAKVDYTILPATESDFEYNGLRALFNFPIRLKKDQYLFLGVNYTNVNIHFGKDPQPFVRDEIDGFQILDINLGYTFKLNADWRFAVRFSPGLSSNLTANDLTIDDFVISGDVVLVRDRKKGKQTYKSNRLIVGISYSGNRGFPFPLPFVSYYLKFDEKWSFNLGVPKSNLQYHFSEKHRLKLYVELDGFTANIQRGAIISDELIAESINMSLILGGLQYEYHFLDHFEFFARSSYIINRRAQLRDNEKDNIFLLDDSNGIYLRTGIRFKI